MKTHLRFVENENFRKDHITKWFNIVNDEEDTIGYIRWRPGWRKYICSVSKSENVSAYTNYPSICKADTHIVGGAS